MEEVKCFTDPESEVVLSKYINRDAFKEIKERMSKQKALDPDDVEELKTMLMREVRHPSVSDLYHDLYHDEVLRRFSDRISDESTLLSFAQLVAIVAKRIATLRINEVRKEIVMDILRWNEANTRKVSHPRDLYQYYPHDGVYLITGIGLSDFGFTACELDMKNMNTICSQLGIKEYFSQEIVDRKEREGVEDDSCRVHILSLWGYLNHMYAHGKRRMLMSSGSVIGGSDD